MQEPSSVKKVPLWMRNLEFHPYFRRMWNLLKNYSNTIYCDAHHTKQGTAWHFYFDITSHSVQRHNKRYIHTSPTIKLKCVFNFFFATLLQSESGKKDKQIIIQTKNNVMSTGRTIEKKWNAWVKKRDMDRERFKKERSTGTHEEDDV